MNDKRGGTVPPPEREQAPEPGQYLDEDGVPHCAVCGEPLRRTLSVGLLDSPLEFSMLCACQRQARDREELARERREKRHRARTAWESSRFFRPGAGLPDFDRDDAPDSDAARICRRYADNWDRVKELNCGLLLMGPVGTGKTFYAGAIMARLLDRGVTCALVSAPQLVNLTMNGQSAAVMDELRAFDLVILDDLGAERDTDYALEQLELFADARYFSGRPLIVTTNLTKTELDDQSDRRRARIYDRIKEMACVPVLLTGRSRRGAAARQKARQIREVLGAGA